LVAAADVVVVERGMGSENNINNNKHFLFNLPQPTPSGAAPGPAPQLLAPSFISFFLSPKIKRN
jgi:hypothetical protein